MDRIAIAGGGIGGLTLAVGLQQRGFDVLVFEQRPDIRDSGAGISLWPNALAALDVLSLGHVVRGLGRAICRGGERKLDGRSGPTFSAQGFVSALGEGLVCVDRGELVRTLAGLLEPGTLQTGCAVSGYEQLPDSLLVRIDGQESIEVAALVGADGIYSVVASQMNGSLEFAYSGYTAWRGISEMEFGPEADQVWACLAGGHEVGWMPVGGGRTYWFATSWLPEAYRPPRGDKAYVRELLTTWPQPVPQLVDSTPADRLVRNDIVDRSALARWSDGPVTVLGDAAHPMRPHLGQGGCQAIEDAAALVLSLDGTFDVREAFARYERVRQARTRRIVRLSKHSRFTRPPGPVTATFDRITAGMPSIPIGRGLRVIRPVAGYSAGAKAARLG